VSVGAIFWRFSSIDRLAFRPVGEDMLALY